MDRLAHIICDVGQHNVFMTVHKIDGTMIEGTTNNYTLKVIDNIEWYAGARFFQYKQDIIEFKHPISFIERSMNERCCIYSNIDNSVQFHRDPEKIHAEIYCKESDIDSYKKIILNQIRERLTKETFNYLETLQHLDSYIEKGAY